MSLVKVLENLGLNEKEAKVYLALLQLGMTTAYSVAIRSGLKKPTAYVILDQLVEKGFARNVPRAKKQLFVAENPESIFSEYEEKVLHTKEALPELLAMRKSNEEKTSVAYYEGIGGVREVYTRWANQIRKKPESEREFVGFYAHGKDAPDDLMVYFDEANEMLRKYGIRRRGVTVHDSSVIKKFLKSDYLKKHMTQLKSLNEEKYSSNISIEVFDRYVHIFSHRFLQVVVIENPDVANVMRQIFEMVWELVEKDKENYLRFSNV